MQDKSIDNVLQDLHRRAMSGTHDGLAHIEALMRIRSVQPTYKRRSPIGGATRKQTRLLVLDALRRGITCNREIALVLLERRPDLTYRHAHNRVYQVRLRLAQ